ncbi:Uncharacterised protein [Streptococcus pneumoniae]|nr:Uncharacterised protein [Streptococcus pneumoniae]
MMGSFFVQGAKRGQNFHNGLILFENLFKPRQRCLAVGMVNDFVSSIEQPVASFLVYALIFIEYEIRYAQID